jgi:hypothetical protein
MAYRCATSWSSSGDLYDGTDRRGLQSKRQAPISCGASPKG